MKARIADMATVTVRYWAAAKQAAGVAEEVLAAGTLAELLAAVLARHPAAPALVGVLARSSFLIDGEQAGNRPPEGVTLREGAVVEVLPPFAGG
jgi:sulfur-carrier protein